MHTASLIFYEMNILKAEAAKVGKNQSACIHGCLFEEPAAAGRAPACHPRCDIFFCVTEDVLVQLRRRGLMVNRTFASTAAQTANGDERTVCACVCPSLASPAVCYGHLKFRASSENERRDYSSASESALRGGAWLCG